MVTKETLAKELVDRLFEQLLLVNIVLNSRATKTCQESSLSRETATSLKGLCHG